MKNKLLLSLSVASLTLAGCGDSGGSTSTTKMTNVEVVDGTISDDMIMLDTIAAEGTSVDNSGSGGLYETIDKNPKPDAENKSDDSSTKGADEKAAPKTEAKAEAQPKTETKTSAPAKSE